MDVSVVIVNYNTTQLLCDAIDSLLSKTIGVEFELIVVDNHSKENSHFLFSEKYKGLINYIYLNENIGFGRANNLGLEYASGRNIFFLNADTLMLNNALLILSDFLDNNDTVGVCGANLYDANLKPTHSYMSLFPTVWSELNILLFEIPFRLVFGKNLFFNHTGKSRKVAYITGADLMIKRSVLNDVHGFDSDFFLYYEETELCHRVKEHGYRIMSVPSAELIHLESKSIKSNLSKQKHLAKSRNLYYKKTQNEFTTQLANLIFKLTCFSRILILGILNQKTGADYWRNQLKCFYEVV